MKSIKVLCLFIIAATVLCVLPLSTALSAPASGSNPHPGTLPSMGPGPGPSATFPGFVPGKGPAKAPHADYAAMVNDKKILKSELDLFVKEELERVKSGGHEKAKNLETTVRERVLEKLVAKEVMLQMARKEGIKATAKEIENALLSPEFKQYQDIGPEKLNEFTKQQIIINKLIDKHVMEKTRISDAEVEKYYKDNPRDFKDPELVKARHIVVLVEPSASAEQKQKARNKIDSLMMQVMDGSVDFGTLAARHSEAADAKKGGDLGYFSLKQMDKTFGEAAFALQPGEISKILKTDYGFHIIKVEDRRKPQIVPLKDAREGVKHFLKSRKASKKTPEWIALQVERADIKIPGYEIISRAEKTFGRLIDNGNGTITHVSTGLMWVQDDSFVKLEKCLSWDKAKEYAENLTIGGHDDWRLPTEAELSTIAAKAPWNKVFNNGKSYIFHWSNAEAGECCARTIIFATGITAETARGACNDEAVRAVRNMSK